MIIIHVLDDQYFPAPFTPALPPAPGGLGEVVVHGVRAAALEELEPQLPSDALGQLAQVPRR
jgi:hypothetical protein